jgi:hypothetical protein
MSEQIKKPTRSSTWYSNLKGKQKEEVLRKKSEREKTRRENTKKAKAERSATINSLVTDNDILKRENANLTMRVIHLNQALNVQPSFVWEYDHEPICPRYQCRGGVDIMSRSTRSVHNLILSTIIPLHEPTSLHVYVGSHNGTPIDFRKSRVYHMSTWMQVKIEKHEAIIFDGNLCHAGGRSDNRCPRIFCTFGTSYAVLEGRNYINECTKCKFEEEEGCSDCDMIEAMRNKTKYEVLHGIEDPYTRYRVLSLSQHGFCLVDLSSLGEFSLPLKEEVECLKTGGADKRIRFGSMGQNVKPNALKKRMHLLGDIKKVMEKKLPHTLQYIKTAETIIASRIEGEYVGKSYNLNEYDVFVNGEHGADCQKVHMDNALLCNCFT